MNAAGRRGISVPYFLTLTADTYASFLGDFRRPAGAEMDPKNEAPLSSIMARNECRPDCWWVVRDSAKTSREIRADRWVLAASYGP